MRFLQSDSNASFLRAARSGNIEKMQEYLKGSIDINASNANGLNALHLAAKEGHINIVTELVKKGANVNAATKKGNTALHITALAGQEEVAKILIRNGANVNLQSQNGFTPLYMAAQENHDNVVKFLLANGANQTIATEDGFTPLAVALQQGHDKVVTVLLENDAKGRVRLPALHIAAKKDDCKAAALLLQNDHDPDVTSKSGFTPLHIAAHYGNENIAAILVNKNADVNYSAKHQITPLHVAAKWGKSNMVTLLLDNGAKIDASTRDGLTPLHCAARSGHEQVVDLMLERSAPITAKTKNGLAPLHMASQGDHVDSARILLYHKAPVDDVTVDYLTALHVAAHCGHVRVANLLLDRKADPNARALNGFTPLHIACKKNRIKVVELLLKHGASIEATTESGLTPLHVASFMGCMNIVIYLIQHGANPDVPTVRGETPLHLAARANQSDIIRILLRNGAHVDASAREQQTPLHIAARLGNVDIVGLLLQHGAAVDSTTKDMYTALHIAAKEGQEEVAAVLLDHGASLTATTKKGFTPLHLAAKYGNIKVATLLIQKDAPVDAQGKNGVTPLHVAAHYDHVNVALLLLDKGAFPHATAKNGYTPLHIAAKKNQMDIATTLLEFGAKPSAESKAGFTPLHLSSQEGHTDMATLLIEHHADVNANAKNGLTPLHLCAQEDKVNVASVLVKNGARVDPTTKAGYTPLHVACHFGQINMIRFLLQHGADVNSTTSHGYTPLHQAAQQGHTLIINLLLEHKASPNTTTNQGQTALSIAQRLGYISVVETLKIVTETIVTTTTTTITEEKYKVVAPETMQETFMSDSEDEGAEDAMLGGDQSFHYMTTDELKALADDNTLGIDVTRDERLHDSTLIAPLTAAEDHLTPQHISQQESTFSSSMAPDNVDLARAPVHAGFLVSFMVDARGGAMRGCRHSGVRVIIPPRKAPMPMRITCRYLRKEKLAYPPPLMEGEACASRILEVGPAGAKFLGPVIIEVPHFASLRGREREITILRSDNGETWRNHSLEASDDAVHDVFNESFEGEELTAIEDLSTNRITRILTTDFPQYFAIITRIRQEVHAIGPEGGMVSSTVIPQVQAIFPEGALTKKIKVGLQAQPITPELVTKLLGNRVAVSPIVTVEPRRRKFHKSITLTIPVPQAATKGMINQYSGDAPTLRLLCSVTGGTTKAQWEDVTGSTPLTFVNDCVSFTTTVSARFWLMDCRQVNEVTKFATELYREAIHVPFMAKFVVFAKRRDPLEAQLRVFCMTDDKEDKTLESQEHFTEVAKSRDVEVLEGKLQFLEFAGNLIPVTKSGEQLSFTFQAFRENRLPFTIRVKDTHQEPMGRVAFMREPRVIRGEPPQAPICNLNIVLPEVDLTPASELVTLEKKYGFVQETSLAKPELIHRADLRLSDIASELGSDWIALALQLDLPESDINSFRSENPDDTTQQALVMLRHWLHRTGNKANGNLLEKGLRKINREDIVNKCMFNIELVTDDVEKAVAKVQLDQSGFDTFKEELGSSRNASLRRDVSLNGGQYDEQDIMKEAESAAESSASESSERDGHLRSGSKHSEKSSRRHIQSRGHEEGLETLVQTVPTAMSESYTQNISNGQMSDSSFHEDDKSEPTIATLSSEATAEMEVSSLEDKSQTETNVEKKDLTRTYLHSIGQRLPLLSNLNRTPLNNPYCNVKSVKGRKNKGVPLGKKVSFPINPWTMTAPAAGKKKKITRRNSWPLESPRRLNVRKKYQRRLKSRDFPEPFWVDTYEWLIMKNSPEEMKSAPLAKLSEIVEAVSVKNFSPVVPYSYNPLVDDSQNVSQSHKFKHPDKIGFYFRFKTDKTTCKDPKQYLMKLRKRCLLESIAPYSDSELNPAQFAEVSLERNLMPYSTDTISLQKSESKSLRSPLQTANAVVDSKTLYENHLINSIRETVSNPFTTSFYETYQHPIEPSRSFEFFNSPSSVDVLAHSNLSSYENDLTSFKHKTVASNIVWNKENITKTNYKNCIPDVKLLEPKQICQTTLPSMPLKGLKVSTHKLKENSCDFSGHFKPEIGFETLPKNLETKNPNIIFAPKDIPDSNSSQSNQPYSFVPSSTGLVSSEKEADPGASTVNYSAGLDTLSSESSTSGFSQRNRPYARQLLAHDIQSNFSKSAKVIKKDSDATEEEKSKQLPVKEMEHASTHPEQTVLHEPSLVTSHDSLSKQIPPGHNLMPAEVIGFNFLKSLSEQVGEISADSTIPASVIGQAFISALIGQQSAFSPNLPEETEAKELLQTTETVSGTPSEKTIPSSVVSQAFLKSLVDSPSLTSLQLDHSDTESFHQKRGPQPIPSNVVGQTFLKQLVQESAIIADSSEVFHEESIQSDSSTGSLTSPKALCDRKNEAIPAPVIGQAFLKNLMEKQDECRKAQVEKPIPSTVVGQSFLKSLISIDPVVKKSLKQGQKFSQMDSASATSSQVVDPEKSSTVESSQTIPAGVLSQSFLKTLVDNTSLKTETDSTSEYKAIPAPVLCQSFLKSLIEKEKAINPEGTSTKPIPSAVVGQSFLKTLITDQSAEVSPLGDPSSSPGTSWRFSEEPLLTSAQDPLPANVVGQAFLKTLLNLSSDSTPFENLTSSTSGPLEQTQISSAISKPSTSDSVFAQSQIESGEFEESSVIPPPPEFSGSEDTESTGLAGADATSGIIGELLNYTRVMHSLFESMNESQPDSSKDTTDK